MKHKIEIILAVKINLSRIMSLVTKMPLKMKGTMQRIKAICRTAYLPGEKSAV